MVAETLADAFDEVKFIVEVDGTDLQFDTTEPLRQLFLHALQHLVVVAHPYEAVDGYAHLTTGKSGVEQVVGRA